MRMTGGHGGQEGLNKVYIWKSEVFNKFMWRLTQIGTSFVYGLSIFEMWDTFAGGSNTFTRTVL